jgi:cytosine/adenosine deaminase-related metal-dependent hydrolase
MSTHIHFATRERDDGTTFVTLRDDAPTWLRDAVYDAHDGEMPNDWRYETCQAICEMIDDGTEDTQEIADSLVDIYNGDRAAWIAGNLHRGNVEIERDHLPEDVSVFHLIGLAQYQIITEMAEVLADAIEQNAADA